MKDIIKLLREKRGLSQNAVADYLGVSRVMYMKYENGSVEPPVKVVKDLSGLYSVSYDVILDNKTSPIEYASSFSNGYELSDAAPFYGTSPVSGTENNLSKILGLLPKLLYSEKAKLLTQVAQSMSVDVEAAKLAQSAESKSINQKSEETMSKFRSFLDNASSFHINSKGKKWTREELYER